MVQKPTLKLNNLSWEDLNSLLYLSETSESGLRWRETVSATALKDSVAGCFSETVEFPCWKIKAKKTALIVSRVIWFLKFKEVPDIIDHKDGNPRNNSLSNLRNVPVVVNTQNRVVVNGTGTSGVYLRQDKYGNPVWRCQGTDINNKRWSKVFAVKKYGNEKAKTLCLEHRKMKELENGTQTREVSTNES